MKTKGQQFVEAFTGGACPGGTGLGGYGVVLRCGSAEKKIQGHEARTTSQRMELQAAVRALEALKGPCRVRLTSDSQYLVKGMTVWLEGWIKTGKIQRPGAMPNQDLWHRLIALSQNHSIEWVEVNGHSIPARNKQAVALAKEAVSQGQAQSIVEESRQLCLC